ncbi:MAG: Ni/Fe-hydrogenase 1 b-type cytochrome subunit [Alphaproteobacteria bacterium]|nr:MAG: Ni/Fe-hydrogenase 1 b-type cytochrome subunit [Alphaproteobacteria bacterium]
MVERVRVWDLPIRLFHWALVLLVPALWATHELDMMDLHILLGEVALGLVLFRLIWGLIGSSTARFAGFLRGPSAVLAYLRAPGGAFGHNPLGGWSVAAMLAVLAVQIGLGLFASDEDGLETGPLSHRVSYESARTLAERHETFFYVLLGLIALHLAAILYYRFARREDLVISMITGSREAPLSGETMTSAPLWRFLAAAALSLGLTLIVANYL